MSFSIVLDLSRVFPVLKELIGDIRVTMRYSHLSKDHLQRAVERLVDKDVAKNLTKDQEGGVEKEMEMGGLEPPAPGLQSRCSPS